MGLIQRLFPLSFVEKLYIERGEWVGDALSYFYMGEAIGFRKKLAKLVASETEYARRGFMPIEIGRFVRYGGYGESLDDVLRQPHNGNPTFYAKEFASEYKGIKPLIDIQEMIETGQGQIVTFSENGEIKKSYFNLKSEQ